MNTAYTIRDFITEYSNVEYTKEYYDILKESAELTCMETYIASQKYIQENADIVDRFDGVFCESVDMYDLYEITESVGEKLQDLTYKAYVFFRNLFRRFAAAMRKLADKLSGAEARRKELQSDCKKILDSAELKKQLVDKCRPIYEKTAYVKHLVFNSTLNSPTDISDEDCAVIITDLASADTIKMFSARPIDGKVIFLSTPEEINEVIDILADLKHGKRYRENDTESTTIDLPITSKALSYMIKASEKGIKLCDDIIANHLDRAKDEINKFVKDQAASSKEVYEIDNSAVKGELKKISSMLADTTAVYSELISVRSNFAKEIRTIMQNK